MKTLLLIDANSLIHRSFHALPPFTSPKGEPTGALYGLSSILLKIIKEQKPDYWAAAFDRPEPTFRKKLFKEYKAQRPKAPDELISQLIRAHEVFEKFGIKTFEQPGFEADDLIAALAKHFKDEKDLKAVILTGDLDTLQLVEDGKVEVETPKKGVSEIMIYNRKAVQERYGLNPEQLPDYKALVGDKSDNILGVPGIGPKTASRLLQEYETLDNLYKILKEKKIEEFPKKNQKLFQKLLDNEEAAYFSKKLVILDQDIELSVGLEELKSGDVTDSLLDYFGTLGFQSLVNRVSGRNPRFEPAVSEEQNNKADVLLITSKEEYAREKQELFSSKLKVGFDFKSLIKELKKENQEIADPIFDLKIAGWLLDPDQKDCSLEGLSRRFLRRLVAEPHELYSSLFNFFDKKIKEYELTKVFEEIEMPLTRVLAEMETQGIKVNKEALIKLKEELLVEIKKLEEKIYKAAGSVFNMNSPKQLSEVLFEKMKIGKGRKVSTEAQYLNTLREGNPIIDDVLSYRETFKMKSGFVEPIIEYVESDGRLHTTFNQTGTATGRLSSEKPNIQNIPSGYSWAVKLRGVFEAEPGYTFAAFDYSQVELRILASVSGDEKMKKAFFEDQDIHKLTASQVFNVDLDDVTPAMRQVGKTLNFGIVYGMGADAFARTAGLSREKSREFIDEYFLDFPGVEKWQEEVKTEARTLGYVKNLNGRRRWFLEMASPTSRFQFEEERAAMNMPIQGLAADIIKLAMIKTFRLGEDVRLLLSIHDELLFEIKDDILEEKIGLIKNTMESVFKIDVPLKVEVKTGKNWGALK